ncbi:MAG: AraC family transcriptional regulator [Thermoflexales bacterium]|nr:AraC family transcriptional regulator [Thermoflexales bacterium]
MITYHIIERPAFDVVGKKTWISGQDNDLFGRFWIQCQKEGVFELFGRLSGNQAGLQTRSSALGVSCVEADPANRAFYYMIAIEQPDQCSDELEAHHVPASQWAVFECVGPVPEAIVKSEIYAFTQWLPSSGYEHAKAPEMEVYFPGNDGASPDSYCEFWLPITKKPGME